MELMRVTGVRPVAALAGVLALAGAAPAAAQLECSDVGGDAYCWDPNTADDDYTPGQSGWGVDGDRVETLRFDSDGGRRGSAKVPERVDFTVQNPPSHTHPGAGAKGTELGRDPGLVTFTPAFSDFDWQSNDPSVCLGGVCQIGSINGLPPFWIPNATGEPRPPVPADNPEQQEHNSDDPVNPANGELVVHATDLELPSFGVRFAHARTYRSRSSYQGSLGFGWDHGYNQRIVPMMLESCQGEVLYLAGGGAVIRFTEVDRTAVYNAEWDTTTYQVRYQAPAGVDLELEAEVAVAGQQDPTVLRQWTLSWPAGIVATFGTEGLLATIKDWNHQGLTFEWTRLEIAEPQPDPEVAEVLSTLPQQVTDPSDPSWDPVTGFDSGPRWVVDLVTDSVNHRFDYAYDPQGRLASVTELDTGVRASYTYSPDGDLATATDAKGRSERYEYDRGHSEAAPDYVPEGHLDSACELACAPSWSSCDAGGVCTGAPARGRSACLAGCIDLAMGCWDACGDYCYYDEGRSSCRQGCSSSCQQSTCTPATARAACDDIWNAQDMDRYCGDCFDEIRDTVCGTTCDSAMECLFQEGVTINLGGGPTTPAYCTGGPGDGTVDWCQSAEVWVDCAIDNGLSQTLSDVGWFLASAGAGIGEAVWCVGTAVACSWNPLCDVDCGFEIAEGYWREMCNDSCNLCRAYGQADDCAPDTSCPPVGDCAFECRQGFYEGYAATVSHCQFPNGWRPPGGDGCVARAELGCRRDCGRQCTTACSQSCEVGCVNACQAEVGVAGPDCWDACWEPENDDWYALCEGSCADSCRAAEREKGPFRGAKYGAPRDLNHNLLRVYDGNGELYVENVYGEDIALADFDRVTRQEYAGRVITYAYQDLDLDIPAAGGEVLLDGGTDAYRSVEVCPGPCLDGPWADGGSSVFFPFDGVLVAVEDGGGKAFPGTTNPEQHVQVVPTLLDVEGGEGEATATSVTRGEPGDVPPPEATFTLEIGGDDVHFEPQGPGTFRLAGTEPAIEALVAAKALLIATDAEGKLWGVPGRVAAVHAVADGRCRVPFTVSHTGGEAQLSPPHACTERFSVTALGSAIDDPAVRGAWTGQPSAAITQQSWHRRSALVPGRAAVRYDTAGGGAFRRALGPDGGAAPGDQRFDIDQANAIRLLGAPPGRITRDHRPLIAYHAEHVIHFDPEGPLIIVTDLPGPFELEPPDQVCFDDPHGPAVGGVGPDAPGPKAVAATRVTDPYGASRTTFYDRGGRLLRRVNDATGATFSYTRDARGQASGVEGPLGGRVCNDYGPLGELVHTTAYPAPGAPGGAQLEQRWLTWRHGPLRLEKVSAIGDPATAVVEHRYDAAGNIERSDWATGEHLAYQVDGRGAVTRTTDESGVETRFAWDSATGLVAARTEDAAGPEPRVTTWTWDRAGKLEQLVAATGLTTTTTYLGERPQTITRAADGITRATTLEHDGDGQLVRAETPLTVTTQGYHPSGHLMWQIARPSDGSVLEQRRCADVGPGGRVLEQVAPNGLRTRYDYDEHGRLRRATTGMWADSPQPWDDLCPQIPGLHPDVEHTVTAVTYDLAGNPLTVTDGRGAVTTHRWDGHGRLVETVAADGAVIRFGYDGQGRRAWTATYDAAAAALPWGPPLPGQPGLSAAAELGYDAVGRLTDVERWHFDAGGPVGDGKALTRTVVDAPNRTVSVVDDTGHTTLIRRDGLGRIDRLTYPTGDVETVAYDRGGRRATRTFPAPTPSGSLATRREVNAWGLPVRDEQLAGGVAFPVASWAYDRFGRLETTKSARGDAVEITSYDPFDRPLQVTFDRGSASERLELVYDVSGRVVARGSDAGAGVLGWTRLERDLLGRVERLELPGGESETVAYLGATALVDTRLDRRGVTWSHGYDPRGRSASVTASAPSAPFDLWTRSFTYDPLGRLVLAATGGDPGDPGDDVDVHFAYDSLGGRTSEWNTLLGAGRAVSHRYDGRGLPQRSVVAGTTVERSFDPLGRLGSLRLGGEPQPTVVWTYSGLGGPAAVQRRSGVASTFAYNELGQLVGQQLGAPSGPLAAWRWEVGLDGVPRLAELQRGGAPASASVFQVGVSGRLLAENHALQGLGGVRVPLGADSAAANAAVAVHLGTGGRWRTYALDGRANWLQRAAGDAGLDVSPSPDANDAYQSFGPEQLGYDAGGALSRRGDVTYGRDAFGQLATVAGPGLGRRYVYDALGRLAAEEDTATGAGTLYGWDGLRRAVRQTAAGVDVTVQSGRDRHAVFIDASGERFDLHQDRLGSVFLVTDAAGRAREWYDYTAYGETTVLDAALATLPASAIGNRFGFQGQQQDSGTGLVQMRHRFLDPEIGRFLAMDPLAELGGSNRYAFVDSAPTAFTDSLGLCKDGRPDCPAGAPGVGGVGGETAGSSGDPRLDVPVDLVVRPVPPDPGDEAVGGGRIKVTFTGRGALQGWMSAAAVDQWGDRATFYDRSDQMLDALAGEIAIGQSDYADPEFRESVPRLVENLEGDWRDKTDVVLDFRQQPGSFDTTVTVQGPYGTRRFDLPAGELMPDLEASEWQATMDRIFGAALSTLEPIPWSSIDPATAAGAVGAGAGSDPPEPIPPGALF